MQLIPIFITFCLLTSTTARSFPEEFYPGHFYEYRNNYDKTDAALEKLEHAPQWVANWPDTSVKMGQVSGVALDPSGLLLVFHRGSNTWDLNTFSIRNVYQGIGDPPIPQPTILVFNDTGELIDSWGQNLFYMPHGITVDSARNVWVTDVALHQVFKFSADNRTAPQMVLGEKFVPGSDDEHFCKPSAVAVMASGDFFVADGYCNTRVIKFAPDGTRVLQWGRRYGESPFVFNVPHALALAGGGGGGPGEVCAADRERGRVACFRADSGAFVTAFRHWLVGPRLFSVAYAPVHGGRLYIVNGPAAGAYGDVPVRGYVIDYTSGRLLGTFAPAGGFGNPHDIAVSPDGGAVYVAELDPHRVHKFVDDALRNETREALSVNASRAKPTATVEASGLPAALSVVPGVGGGVGALDAVPLAGGGGAWRAWGGAAGGALAAAGALLLLALCRARSRGRKSVGRRRWEYGHGEFKLRRLLERRRFTRVQSDDSDDEPAPMLPPPTA